MKINGHIRNTDLLRQYILSFALYSHTRNMPITQKVEFAKEVFFFVTGHSMVANSAKVPVVFISFVTTSRVLQTAWTSVPSSVQSTTANLFGDGTTNGSHILK